MTPKKQDSESTSGKEKGKDSTEPSQPPPPEMKASSEDVPWEPTKGKGKIKIEAEAIESIYTQLMETKALLGKLLQETKEAKIRRRLALMPVKTGDIMRGFQAAVAKANRSNRAGEKEGEDIERMSIKDLEVSLNAPITAGGHAEDPVMMLPNINSADAESATISLKFNVVSIPFKRGS